MAAAHSVHAIAAASTRRSSAPEEELSVTASQLAVPSPNASSFTLDEIRSMCGDRVGTSQIQIGEDMGPVVATGVIRALARQSRQQDVADGGFINEGFKEWSSTYRDAFLASARSCMTANSPPATGPCF